MTIFHDLFKQFLPRIVSSNDLHARWLNTLSYLENCGARKIAACEHPTQVKEEMLKHAAEEFRHAHHLKRQIEKISTLPMEDYALPHLLGGRRSLHYLDWLDSKTCRYLSRVVGLPKQEIKAAAYLLVTYAIELRAAELYPMYEEVLRATGSKVTVKSILLEEEEHLREMEAGLLQLAHGKVHAEYVCALEQELCQEWLGRLLS